MQVIKLQTKVWSTGTQHFTSERVWGENNWRDTSQMDTMYSSHNGGHFVFQHTTILYSTGYSKTYTALVPYFVLHHSNPL